MQLKYNSGTSILEEIPLTDQYKLWADEFQRYLVAWTFSLLVNLSIDYMYVFSVLMMKIDAIHTTKGKEYILEVNDTSIGLGPGMQLET
jgi:hypothetical protein